ncbi:MAG: protein kinase, partial [Planctomycetaceae bacterium]|nr:protein kinase [Planctomycetaceae bacterium]
ASNPTAVKRFLKEARSIAAVSHPNIVQVHDYGRDKEGPFLIMEYVSGGTLHDRCKQGPIPMEEAVGLVCQLCDGLSKAHAANIIHRDIKPSNVLVTTDGFPKLTDFGLAKFETVGMERSMTVDGAVLGTPDFMPPEQRRDASLVDHRSDLWSLAATLYQMVTGESPRIIRIKKLPNQLRDLLDQALETSPDERFQQAIDFGSALKASLTEASVDVAANVDLGAGECAKCHTRNDSQRKFCRECAASLRVPCLGCESEIPIWDKVCGECGAKQLELIE